jgi:UDP-glucose 4-epimerase
LVSCILRDKSGGKARTHCAVTSLSGARILVTGASGFIGTHLANRLLAAGATVTGWVRRATSGCSRCKLEVVNALSPDSVRRAMSGRSYDSVVHLASSGRQVGGFDTAAREARALATFLDVQAAGVIGRLVTFGSADEYGSQGAPQSEWTERKPLTAYGLAKTVMTEMARVARRQGSDVVTLRPFSIYGVGMPSHMFVAQALAACAQGLDFEMRNGSNIRDFVEVGDVCDAVMLALEADQIETGEYNLGTGIGTSIADVGALIVHLAGARIRLVRGAHPPRLDPKELVADPRRAHDELGWAAQTSLAEGLRRLVEVQLQRV